MKPKLTPQTIVKRNPGLVTSNIDGEIVMMSIDNGEYYGLDDIGSRIWDLIENEISVEQLVEKLIEEFEVVKEDCFNDTVDFLVDLSDKKLIAIL